MATTNSTQHPTGTHATQESYLEAITSRLVVFDGAMGTNLQLANLTSEDFGGKHLEGCNEILTITKPDVVYKLHRAFLEAGAEVIETNTFGANAVVLEEYGLAERTSELNLQAARLARQAINSLGKEGGQRWVAGSIGPGTKLPSLGQVSFEELRQAYEVQANALLAGGVDLFLIETVFDLLQAKAAIAACRGAMRAAQRQIPIQVQVTLESTGQMLPGTDISAVLTTLEAMHPDAIGINCSTGPSEMREAVRYLTTHSTLPVACQPNAGLPKVVAGHMHYDLTADELADYLKSFVEDLGVSIVGGCCGTTPEHLSAVVRSCKNSTLKHRAPSREPAASSLYTSVPFRQETSFLIVGERANANGSKSFREAMLSGDYDRAVSIARQQVKDGAHIIDLCVDYTGADGVKDMTEISSRLSTQSPVPLMIDSTEPEVIEAALRRIGGRAIINSVNLEEGDGPGSRLDAMLSLAKEYGAAVVVTCIDSEGQARTGERKLAIAKAVANIATGRYGLSNSDLFFDPLVLPLSTGMEESRRDGLETIEGIARIKSEIPGAYTIIGVSNVSFGLSANLRQALNSVFLHECRQAGLDAAILNPSRILPLNKIPEEVRKTCLDLIYDRRSNNYDPLAQLLSYLGGEERSTGLSANKGANKGTADWPIEKRLEQRIIDGNKEGIEKELEEALDKGYSPLEIVSDILLAGMRTVGELFGSGEMQLPFVLASAETMKAAVSYLEPKMERVEGTQKGTVVLATVAGDVHDIGKNLVDIILTNNGYRVYNLGIKVPLSEMAKKAEEVGADAIGMSGLLVKSTLVMRDNLEELNRLGLARIPVILGGAALTRTFVERDLRKIYEGRVFYGKDAFEGLATMERLMEMRSSGRVDPDFGRKPSDSTVPSRLSSDRYDSSSSTGEGKQTRSPQVSQDNPIFPPPFVGSRVTEEISIDEIIPYLNETALYRNQWGYRPLPGEDARSMNQRVRAVLNEQLEMVKSEGVLIPKVAWAYLPANSEGNDLIIWEDESRRKERLRFSFPRQKEDPWLCVADFFRGVESEEEDWVALHAVTMGDRVSKETAALFSENHYRDYLLLHGLGVEMTEALAEYWHARIRQEWGFADEDDSTLAGLFRQRYRGGRYSFGYPACPNLEDNAKLLELVEADRIGVGLTDGFQLLPEQTTTALICHHPQAKYFVT